MPLQNSTCTKAFGKSNQKFLNTNSKYTDTIAIKKKKKNWRRKIVTKYKNRTEKQGLDKSAKGVEHDPNNQSLMDCE